MDRPLNDLLKDLALEQLLRTPVGEGVRQAAEAIQELQRHYAALLEKQDELDQLGTRAATVATFAILRKIAEGRNPAAFDAQDWQDIAAAVSEFAILPDGRQYSVSIFGLYARYIRFSAKMIESRASAGTVASISALADALEQKAEELDSGMISEVAYTEECLWIALEAMVKLLATTPRLCGKGDPEFSQALASFAIAYGRLMLCSAEQELVDQFMESQYQMDEALEQKYAGFLEQLGKQTEQFYSLLDNAFAPDFQESFLRSALLAKAAGVSQEDILADSMDIDHFFLD